MHIVYLMSIKKVNNPSFIKKYEQIKRKAVRVVVVWGGGGQMQLWNLIQKLVSHQFSETDAYLNQ